MAYAIPPSLQGAPLWQVEAARRLRFAMLLAALIVTGILSIFRMPSAGEPLPLVELVVRLIDRVTEATPDEIVETDLERQSEIQPTPAPATEMTETETAADVPVEPVSPANQADTLPSEIIPLPLEAVDREDSLFPATEVQQVEDWREFGTEVVQEFIANLPKPFTVNPVMDEKRRVAAIKFRPSAAPVRVEPWDRVEKDQIGRTILDLGGGCFRVLDDPSAVYRDVFETFTQFVTMCTFQFGKAKPRELPWVKEIRARYPYLQRREAEKRDPNAF